MTTVAQLRAVISLEDREFQQGIQRSERSLNQLVDAAKRTGQALKNDLDQVLKSIDGRDALKGVTDAFTGLGSAAGGALKGILGLFGQLASSVVNVAGQIASTLTGALNGALKAAGALAATLGGALGAAFIGLGKTGIDMNLTLRSAQAGLTAITGSAAKAAEVVEQLRQTAITTQPTFKELLPMGTQLAAAYGPAGIGRVIPTLLAFDAVQKTLSLNTENVKGALLQLRQVLARGSLQTEELNTIEENLAGADVRGILRKAFGSGDPETLTKAGITGRQVADAIVDGFNQRFGSATGALSAGLPVALSGFQDTLNELAGKVTARFLPQVEGAVGKVLAAFQKLAGSESFLRALTVPFDLLGKALEWVAGQAPKFAEWLEKVATQQNVVNVLSQAAGWVQTLGQEVARFIDAATGGQGLGSVFTAFQSVAEKAIDGVLRGWNVLVSSIRFLSDHAGEIWQVFADAMKPAQKALDALIGAVTVLAGAAVGGKLMEFLGKFQINPGGGGPAMAGMWGVGAGEGRPIPQASDAKGPWHYNSQGVGHLTREEAQRAGIKVLRPGEIAPDWGRVKQSIPNAILGPQTTAQLPGTIFDTLSGIGAQVRGEIGKGFGAAAGAVPDRLKGLWSGFQAQAQTAWNDGGLDALRKRQEENARRIQGQINRALLPTSPAAGDGIAPGHVMSGRTGGAAVADAAVAALTSDKDAKKAEKEAAKMLGARQAAFDALLAQARAMAEVAGDGEKAQTEARVVLPALEAKLQELSRQALQLLPKARTSADAAKDYWDTVKQGYAVQGQMNDLQQRAQQEQENALKKIQSQAKEALEKARKAVTDRLRGADLLVQFRESQIANIPGLNDRQRQQALVPALLQKYFTQNQAAAGAEGNDWLEQMIGANQTRARILESAGIMSGGRLRVGQRQARLAFAQLDEIANRALHALPSAPRVAGGAEGRAGAPSVRVSSSQITINYDGNRPLTEADWQQFRRMYERARQQEIRDSGLIGPSGGSYRR